MSEGFRVTSMGELPEIPVEGAGIVWRPIRRTLGIKAFGVNAYTAEPGEHVVEEHTEERLRHEELYVVVAGRARFELDGETIDAPAGTLVFVQKPEVKRVAFAEEPGTTVLAIGGKPGEAFTPSAWEYFFAAYSHAAKQDFEQAMAELQQGFVEKPDHPALYYHLACIESRAGRVDDAVGHLSRALELDPKFREYASKDPDLVAACERLGIPRQPES